MGLQPPKLLPQPPRHDLPGNHPISPFPPSIMQLTWLAKPFAPDGIAASSCGCEGPEFHRLPFLKTAFNPTTPTEVLRPRIAEICLHQLEPILDTATTPWIQEVTKQKLHCRFYWQQVTNGYTAPITTHKRRMNKRHKFSLELKKWTWPQLPSAKTHVSKNPNLRCCNISGWPLIVKPNNCTKQKI